MPDSRSSSVSMILTCGAPISAGPACREFQSSRLFAKWKAAFDRDHVQPALLNGEVEARPCECGECRFKSPRVPSCQLSGGREDHDGPDEWARQNARTASLT